MKKVLITGGNGYIAKNINDRLKDVYSIETISRNNFSLLDTDSVDNFFKGKFYDVIVHTASIVHDNVKMLYNILSNKNNYNRLINLGSGAELGYPKTPYGISKSLISNIINSLDKHYNLRIFAVFNENELETRFIKSNILKYLKKQDIIIHQNKLMDFFSFNDFIKVIRMYIEVDDIYLDKTFDCCYSKKNSLLDIANIINNLDTYSVAVNIENKSQGDSYIGNFFTRYDLQYIGLEKSIEGMYEVLKNKPHTL
jgi:dTDP-4-dehydrorhamnose reductase